MTTSTEFATKIFRSEMTSPPISKFFLKFMTKSAVSNAKKLQQNLLDQKRPPPFGNFPKIHPNLIIRSSLKLERRIKILLNGAKGKDTISQWPQFWAGQLKIWGSSHWPSQPLVSCATNLLHFCQLTDISCSLRAPPTIFSSFCNWSLLWLLEYQTLWYR